MERLKFVLRCVWMRVGRGTAWSWLQSMRRMLLLVILGHSSSFNNEETTRLFPKTSDYSKIIVQVSSHPVQLNMSVVEQQLCNFLRVIGFGILFQDGPYFKCLFVHIVNIRSISETKVFHICQKLKLKLEYLIQNTSILDVFGI